MGCVAEWSCSGLQSRVRRSDSGLSLQFLAQVAKQVDARDLKSLGGNTMPVRFRPRAPSFITRRGGIMLRSMGFFIPFLLYSFSSPAYAYIDPSVGSLWVQSLIAMVVAMMSVVKLNWLKLKNWFHKRKKTRKGSDEQQ